VEINEIQNGKAIEKINETKGWIFKKINKIDKPLATPTKKKREKTQMTKTRNTTVEIATYPIGKVQYSCFL
jgi:hypothetical protein